MVDGPTLVKDVPGISLEPDFSTGLCLITIRRLFDVEPIAIHVPIVDILTSAANMTLTMCDMQRAAMRART